MSYPISELILKEVIKKGLESITTDIDLWTDEIFADYRNPLLGQEGVATLRDIKAYLSGETGDLIEVVSGFPTTLQASNIVYVTLNRTDEDTPKQSLGDRWESIKVPTQRRTVVDFFDAVYYDPSIQTLKIPASFDLSAAEPKFLLQDYKNNFFEIAFPLQKEVDNTYGEVWILKLNSPNLVESIQNLKIVSFVDYKIQHRGAIWYYENLSVMIQTPSYHKTFWLYMAIAYILQSLKPVLEASGFELSVFNARDLGRLPDREPDFVAGRQIDIRWRTQATFIHGSSLVPDTLRLFITPGRVNNEEVLTYPTRDQVLYDLSIGLPGQTITGIED